MKIETDVQVYKPKNGFDGCIKRTYNYAEVGNMEIALMTSSAFSGRNEGRHALVAALQKQNVDNQHINND